MPLVPFGLVWRTPVPIQNMDNGDLIESIEAVLFLAIHLGFSNVAVRLYGALELLQNDGLEPEEQDPDGGDDAVQD